MKTGLLYVSFGSNCDRLLAYCVAYSRQFTKLPICVLTNITESQRDAKWRDVDNIEFIYFDLPTESNRQIKTTMNQYAPFDYNIYMDADSFIWKVWFDDVIQMVLSTSPDIVFNHFCDYPYADGRFQNIYLRALRQFGCEMPLRVYNGAFIGFKKNANTDKFFLTWNMLWKEFGAQREMPPLACAVQKVKELKINCLPPLFFCPDGRNDDSVVQHNYGEDFYSRIGVEPIALSHQATYETNAYGFTQL